MGPLLFLHLGNVLKEIGETVETVIIKLHSVAPEVDFLGVVSVKLLCTDVIELSKQMHNLLVSTQPAVLCLVEQMIVVHILRLPALRHGAHVLVEPCHHRYMSRSRLCWYTCM